MKSCPVISINTENVVTWLVVRELQTACTHTIAAGSQESGEGLSEKRRGAVSQEKGGGEGEEAIQIFAQSISRTWALTR